MTLKKTDYEIIGLLREQIDRLCLRLASRHLFPQRPQLHFSSLATGCRCGADTRVLKTQQKILATLAIGQFEALETQRHCPRCGKIYRSEELRALTPHRGQFGFDVIEHIGRALFVHCRSERAVQAELAAGNIPISISEISFLGKRFIVYLALAHRACQGALREHMAAKGGYILHLDATCEGDSPQLFSCLDEIGQIVLGNRKMPTEDSEHIIPLLRELKAAYGTPLALVHDMGGAILKAVATVFPTVPDYICHFHFLRDLGRDLFDFEYRTIRRYTRDFKAKATLSQAGTALQEAIDNEPALSDNLQTYLDRKAAANDNPPALTPWVSAYLLVAWVLEADSAGEGFGFPFDRPHLVFYQRLREAYPALKKLKAKGVSVLPLSTLHRMLSDAALHHLVTRIEQKITRFDRLREAMRIARPDGGQGLNDDGDGQIKTIESRVKAFRYSKTITALSASDISYQKMAKQIDKYWDKLFADPIAVNTPAGTVMIQPQRTNNLMEQSFRFLKRDGRKKTGQKALSRTLVAMLADTPLVRNLDNPDYMRILLNGKATLAARFADIDIQQVREEEQANHNRFRKYPKNMRRLFRVPHLPRKIMKAASM
jgi:hypothetical protein